MSTTVLGIYKKGSIQLLETPTGVREGRVLVTLQDDIGDKSAPKQMTFGQYSGGRMSTKEDFKIAEWHGEEEFNAD